MIVARLFGAAALTATMACERTGGRPDQEPAAETTPVAPAESLALRIDDSVSVWFAAGRTGRDSTGTQCVERTLEIRRGTHIMPVPLLYTGAVPVAVDDSTVEAELWRDCRLMDVYRVDLRSGQPKLVRR